MAEVPTSNIPILTAAFLAVLSTGGPTYAFGLYGDALKQELGLTQSQLDTISSANFCAGFFTWLPGIAVDRYGIRNSMIGGGIFEAVFMVCYWVISKQMLRISETWILPVLCLFGVLMFMSNGLVVGSTFKVFASVCKPTTKGSAVGIAKGYVGLGSGVYATMFQALKSIAGADNISDLDFLPMAATIAFVTCSLSAFIFIPRKEIMDQLVELSSETIDKSTHSHLGILYTALGVLVLLVLGTSLVDLFDSSDGNTHKDDSDGAFVLQSSLYYVAGGLLVLAFWWGPIMALLLVPSTDEGIAQSNGTRNVSTEEHALLVNTNEKPRYVEQPTEPNKAGESTNNETNENYNLLDLLGTGRAWLLVWCGIVLVGGGTMLTNNMGQMVKSLKFDQEVVTTAATALFSVAQATSRIVTGAISDSAMSWHFNVGSIVHVDGITRPSFLVVASFVGSLAHATLALATNEWFFITGVFLGGIAFGMVWPLMVLIVGEVFGTKNMGTNYMFYDGAASAVGTILFSKYITQEVYENHKRLNDNACFGPECFAITHWVISAFSLSCVIGSYLLTRMTKHSYQDEH